jgi:hypothetical protein
VKSNTFKTDKQTHGWLLRALRRINPASFSITGSAATRVPGSARRWGQAGLVAGVLTLTLATPSQRRRAAGMTSSVGARPPSTIHNSARIRRAQEQLSSCGISVVNPQRPE